MPELTTAQNGAQAPVASLDAITVLVHSFGSMISSMEARITARINENAAASKERWSSWEADFRQYRDANDRRVALLEDRVGTIEKVQEREKIVWDARLGPLRSLLVVLSRSWRTILVVAFAILGALGLANSILADGLHALGLP